jgi:adenylate kinase
MEVDPSKLKVTELRSMLSGRNLDTKGTKPELVKRLNESFSNESLEIEGSSEVNLSVGSSEQSSQPMNEENNVIATDGLEDATTDTNEEKVVNYIETQAKDVEIDSGIEQTSEAMNEENEIMVTECTKIEKRLSPKPKEATINTLDEPLIEDSVHCLDWYDSDLSLKIDKNNMTKAEPFYKNLWEHVWSGARSTQGFVTGKVCYEVRILEGKKTESKNEIIIGWSTNDTCLLLGKEQTSYGYCSKTGKSRFSNNFKEYGKAFGKGDVVGTLLDMDDTTVKISFTLNGATQGEAFSIPKDSLNGQALFPHICTKNFTYEVNFGKEPVSLKSETKPVQYTVKDGPATQAWHSPPDVYKFAAFQESIPNIPGIKERQKCELIMMVGLPGSGKTTWVNNWKKKLPEKRYNSIGLNELMDRMEADGEPIMKKIPANQWGIIVKSISENIRMWTSIAATRRRNIILDQVNTTSWCHSKANSTQIIPFNDVYLRAVVVVPSDDEYKKRLMVQKTEANTHNDRYLSSENQIRGMKARFALPADGEESPFKEINFTELNREEASKVVQQYNGEANKNDYKNKYRRGRLNRSKVTKMPLPPKMQNTRKGSSISQLLSTQEKNSLSKESLMHQANLIQNAVIKNGWMGSPMRGAQSIVGNGQSGAISSQTGISQGMFNGAMNPFQAPSFWGGSLNQMFGGGYMGMGMNARRF